VRLWHCASNHAYVSAAELSIFVVLSMAMGWQPAGPDVEPPSPPAPPEPSDGVDPSGPGISPAAPVLPHAQTAIENDAKRAPRMLTAARLPQPL
jgi:hypothetical protein